MTSLPPSRDGNPLDEPSSSYAVGPPPKRRFPRTASQQSSSSSQVHKVYGEDKNHWFVICAAGRLTKDHPKVAPFEEGSLGHRLPADTEFCDGCFSTRERIALRREARGRCRST